MRYLRCAVALPMLLAATVFIGCENDVVDPMARYSFFTAIIDVSTSGPAPDPDGYFVRLDPAGVGVAIPAQGRARVDDLAKGPDHVVTLEGVAGNCAVDGGNPRTIQVEENDIQTLAITVDFDVVCD